DPGARVTGVVVAAAGDQLVGAEIQFHEFDIADGPRGWIETNGSYSLGGFRPGRYRPTVISSAHEVFVASGLAPEAVVASGAPVTPYDIPLVRAATVAVQISCERLPSSRSDASAATEEAIRLSRAARLSVRDSEGCVVDEKRLITNGCRAV